MIPVWFTDTITPDVARAANYTLMWGLEGVVLRHLERGTRVPEVNEAKLRNRLAADELDVAAIEPGLFNGPPAGRAAWMNDLARLDESIAFCRRIGCKRIIIDGLPDGPPEEAAVALGQAARRAAAADMTLLVNNHGEGRQRGADIAALLEHADADALKACWDPAGALGAGEEAMQGLESLRGRIGLVVARDMSRSASGWGRAPLGEGHVGWAAIFSELVRQGFSGPVALDLTGWRPPDGLREATRLIYLLRDALRG